MTEIFKMPDIGEGMAEGEISEWLVKVGDEVKTDDPVAEVQNDKLLQEILSPYTGKVTKLYVEAGTTVSVGDPLIEYDGDGSDDSAAPVEAAPAAKEEAVTPAPQAVQPAEAQATTVGAPVVNGQIKAMPSVRQYARQHGIDLTQVPATGRHGHVTMADVKSFNPAAAPVAPVTTTPAPETVVTPTPTATETSAPKPVVVDEPLKVGRVAMTPVRKAIAKNMVTQKQTIPHVTNFDQVEVSKLVAHRAEFKEVAKEKGIHLTYLAYVTKSLASLGKQIPELNAYVDMDKQEIVYAQDVNIGIAVNAPTGLFVPVIKHADSKSILTIAKEIAELADKARTGTLTPAEMSDATMTISNLGSARGSWFTPIINTNQSMILGVGTIAKEPIVNDEGEIVVGQNMKLSLSYDHRLIDGMLAQTALNGLKKMLADPAYMLMEV